MRQQLAAGDLEPLPSRTRGVRPPAVTVTRMRVVSMAPIRASALYRSTARPGLVREGRELLQRRSVAQTVRIPAELAYERSDLELEIER
jgi:hypothetical protein